MLRAQVNKPGSSQPNELDDWTCPMDPQIHQSGPGKCPLCGMTLVQKVPDRREYPLEVSVRPSAIHPGEEVTLSLRVISPEGAPVQQFALVHEKLMHLFLVNENLAFFAHVHPEAQADGSFDLSLRLPDAGMYRLLADYYPLGATPQLAMNTLYVTGTPKPAHLIPSVSPQKAQNLQAALRIEPEPAVAGLLTRLFYDLDPSEGLEPYLGAMAHMLVASADLVDLMHVHPTLSSGSTMQFDLIFPRAGYYKIWTQFQRKSVVNTVAFVIAIQDL